MAAVVEQEAALDEERSFGEFPVPTKSLSPSGKLTFEQANKLEGVMVITANERRWITDTLACPELLLGFSVNVQDIFSWPSAATKTAE
jgi:hypothetical protein